jgi:hypothetical protein
MEVIINFPSMIDNIYDWPDLISPFSCGLAHYLVENMEVFGSNPSLATEGQS